MRFKLSLVLFLVVLIMTPLVSSFFPISHRYIFEKSLSVQIDSNIKRAIDKYPDLAYASSELVDVSVIYYLTKFSRYSVTHSPSFCRSLLENANTEKEIAIAGGCIIHLSSDLQSHNEMVPYSIKKTLLVNTLIHPFSEEHLDIYVENLDPTIKSRTITSMNSYKEAIPLLKKVLQENIEYRGVDLDLMFDKFVKEMQGSKTGYDASFNNITALPLILIAVYIGIMALSFLFVILLIFKREKNIFNYISLFLVSLFFIFLLFIFIVNIGGKSFQVFVKIIKPISNLVPIGNPEYHLQKAIDNTVNAFKYGEQTLYGKEPSGATELKKASNSIIVYDYIILFIIVTLIAIFIYFNLRKKRSKLSL